MERLFPASAKYSPSYMRVMLAQKVDDPKSRFRHITGSFQPHSDLLCLETQDILDEGTYYAYIELDWNTELINKFALCVLGYNIEVKEVNPRECPTFLEDCIKDYAKNKVAQYRSKEAEPDIRVKHYLGEETAGYGFHYYENRSQNDTTMVEGVKYTK